MKQPMRILSLGAGVQSTTLLYMAIAGEIETFDAAIFADTGWEPRAVYEHVEKLKPVLEAAAIPFHIVSSGNIRQDALDENHRFASMPIFVRNPDGSAGMGRRQCTSEYKLKPVLLKQRELVGLKPRQRSKEHLMDSIVGISWDESQRMRDATYPWMRNVYPLVDLRMTREDCLKWMKQHNHERPPRSACIGCPFKSQEEWIHLRSTSPEDFADAVDFDEKIRGGYARTKEQFKGQAYLHRSLKPLSEIDLSTEEERGIMSLFPDWEAECQGMCGL
jgi:hypothetical protein